MSLPELKLSVARVLYSYSPKTLRTSGAPIGYGYGSQHYTALEKPHSGFMAASTQAMLNNLPAWTSIRNDSDSVGWGLVNAFGLATDRMSSLIDEFMRGLFVATADKRKRHKVYKSDIPDPDSFIPRSDKNLLFNASFVIPDVRRLALPAGWTNNYKNNANYYTLDFVAGGRSVKLSSSSISQSVDMLRAGKIPYLTLSVFARALSGSPSLGAVVAAQDLDSKVNSKAELFTNISQNWRRYTVTLTAGYEMFSAQVIFASTGGEVLIDCCQLEIADAATTWAESPLTIPPGGSNDSPIAYIEARSSSGKVLPVFPVADEDEFALASIPTRIEPISAPGKSVEPISPKNFGEEVTAMGERIPKKWVVHTSKVAEATSSDILRTYTIRDLRYGNLSDLPRYGTFNDTTVTITPLDCVVVSDVLYVAVKETYNGKTLYILKICTPYRPPKGDYIESIADLEIPIFQNTLSEDGGDEISSIGISDVSPNILVVNTTKGRRLYYRLYFDYYHIPIGERTLYTLESYPYIKVV